jgi:hypothetical protein
MGGRAWLSGHILEDRAWMRFDAHASPTVAERITPHRMKGTS